MSIKRVSDLKKRSFSTDTRDDFQTVLDDAYNGGTELANSLMEISWNKNPSKINGSYSDGDDNEFESQSITIHALSAGITDALYNREVYLKGNKHLVGDLNLTGNVNINKGTDLCVNNYNVNIYGYNTVISGQNDIVLTSGHDTVISSNHYTIIKGQTSVIIEIDNPNPGEKTAMEFKDKEMMILSSGNHLSVFGNSDMNLIYGPSQYLGDDETSLTIWHRMKDGSMKAMLQFVGDNVYARGQWYFPESSPTSGNKPIDGYIKHSYYS